MMDIPPYSDRIRLENGKRIYYDCFDDGLGAWFKPAEPQPIQICNQMCVVPEDGREVLARYSKELDCCVVMPPQQAYIDVKEENQKIKCLLADMLKVLEEANPPIAEFVEYNAKCACYLREETHD